MSIFFYRRPCQLFSHSSPPSPPSPSSPQFCNNNAQSKAKNKSILDFQGILFLRKKECRSNKTHFSTQVNNFGGGSSSSSSSSNNNNNNNSNSNNINDSSVKKDDLDDFVDEDIDQLLNPVLDQVSEIEKIRMQEQQRQQRRKKEAIDHEGIKEATKKDIDSSAANESLENFWTNLQKIETESKKSEYKYHPNIIRSKSFFRYGPVPLPNPMELPPFTSEQKHGANLFFTASDCELQYSADSADQFPQNLAKRVDLAHHNAASTSIASQSSPSSSYNVPEVAFCGRSNVGKSSLLNAILNRKKVSKVSSTPVSFMSLFRAFGEDSLIEIGHNVQKKKRDTRSDSISSRSLPVHRTRPRTRPSRLPRRPAPALRSSQRPRACTLSTCPATGSPRRARR